MVLKFPSLMVQRLRSKAFSPVCLFRFSEFLPLHSLQRGEEKVGATRLRDEGAIVKPFNAFVSGVKKEKQYVGSFIL